MTPSMTSSKAVRVAAVQANVPQLQKFDPQFASQILEKFQRLSEIALRANPPPDLLVWPESSVLRRLVDNSVQQFAIQIVARHQSDLLFGIDDVDNRTLLQRRRAYLCRRTSNQIYRKFHLVPFGEYIPLRHSFPLFAAVASNGSRAISNPGPITLFSP